MKKAWGLKEFPHKEDGTTMFVTNRAQGYDGTWRYYGDNGKWDFTAPTWRAVELKLASWGYSLKDIHQR
jgi:hypothetical protein